jgi:hypothetical protein
MLFLRVWIRKVISEENENKLGAQASRLLGQDYSKFTRSTQTLRQVWTCMFGDKKGGLHS